MSECPELNAMIQHMTDDELEERRCGLKKEKLCCKKDVQGEKLSNLTTVFQYHFFTMVSSNFFGQKISLKSYREMPVRFSVQEHLL